MLPLHLSFGEQIFISACGHEDLSHGFEVGKIMFQRHEHFLTVMPYCFMVRLLEKVCTLRLSTVWQTQNPGGKFTLVHIENGRWEGKDAF